MREVKLDNLQKYFCSNILWFYVLMILSVEKVNFLLIKKSITNLGKEERAGWAGGMTLRERREGDRATHRIWTGDSGPK